jgi:hypothetical protein
MDTAFSSTVYIQPPGENFRKDWVFIPKKPDDRLPMNVAADEPCWILYEKTVNPLDEVLRRVRPQIDMMYKKIQEDKNAGTRIADGGTEKIKEKRKTAAMGAFRENKINFPDISEALLSDLALYELSNRPYEEFVGRLLKKIVQKKGFTENNSRKLFNTSKPWKWEGIKHTKKRG